MCTRGFHDYHPTPVSQAATHAILDNLDYTGIRTLDPSLLATSYWVFNRISVTKLKSIQRTNTKRAKKSQYPRAYVRLPTLNTSLDGFPSAVAIDAKDKPISWPRKLWNTALPPAHAGGPLTLPRLNSAHWLSSALGVANSISVDYKTKSLAFCIPHLTLSGLSKQYRDTPGMYHVRGKGAHAVLAR
jgi:hypothetical protein